MEVSGQEDEEIPIRNPINSRYGNSGDGHHHDRIGQTIHHYLRQNSIPHITQRSQWNVIKYKKVVKYRECLKNHAAAMGGDVTDGCGEFMPSGREGTIEALTCSACGCHRNFHRKEVEDETPTSFLGTYHSPIPNKAVARKVMLGNYHQRGNMDPETIEYPSPTVQCIVPSRAAAAQPHQMMISYNMGSLHSESDELEDHGVGQGGIVVGPMASHQGMMKKRFRTKFTPEQKEKMLKFAEKVGWKMQKQEEAVVQQLCQNIGVKRRVLKIWMHNNKHNLAKKIIINSSITQNQVV